MKNLFAILAAVGVAAPAFAVGPPIKLHIVGVHDGDTITGVTEDKQQVKVRLAAIDAPEIGQPFGQAAKKAISLPLGGGAGHQEQAQWGRNIWVVHPLTAEKTTENSSTLRA